MSMIVDYLVVCSNGGDLTSVLAKLLRNVIEAVYDKKNIYNELPEEEELKQYITIRYTKIQEDGGQICGFSVEFDIASLEFDITEEQLEVLIPGFSKSVRDCEAEGIEHLLKLNDPQLQRTLRKYGEEIFKIEMQLREVLSLIFVDTYGEDFYNLLKDADVKPFEESDEDYQMEDYYENQFFFLLFSDYIKINVRKQPDLKRIVERIKEAKDFETLQQGISTEKPITKEKYVNLLERLKQRVKPIEDLRNCVAHNRSIPQTIIDNYEMAKDLLLKEINEFFKEQASADNAIGD